MPSYRERAAHMMGRVQWPVTATPTWTAARHACCPHPARMLVELCTAKLRHVNGPCFVNCPGPSQALVAELQPWPGGAALPCPEPTSEASLCTPPLSLGPQGG